MQYDTCLTYFLNQDFNTLTYCYTEWVRATFSFLIFPPWRSIVTVLVCVQANLVNWLSSDCSAANGANGGLCVASDQRWYVQ